MALEPDVKPSDFLKIKHFSFLAIKHLIKHSIYLFCQHQTKLSYHQAQIWNLAIRPT